jgi:hypothetical protein
MRNTLPTGPMLEEVRGRDWDGGTGATYKLEDEEPIFKTFIDASFIYTHHAPDLFCRE